MVHLRGLTEPLEVSVSHAASKVPKPFQHSEPESRRVNPPSGARREFPHHVWLRGWTVKRCVRIFPMGPAISPRPRRLTAIKFAGACTPHRASPYFPFPGYPVPLSRASARKCTRGRTPPRSTLAGPVGPLAHQRGIRLVPVSRTKDQTEED